MGQRNVTLLKKKVNSDFDSYKMTIQKAQFSEFGHVLLIIILLLCH